MNVVGAPVRSTAMVPTARKNNVTVSATRAQPKPLRRKAVRTQISSATTRNSVTDIARKNP